MEGKIKRSGIFFDTTVEEGSENPPTSNAVAEMIKNLDLSEIPLIKDDIDEMENQITSLSSRSALFGISTNSGTEDKTCLISGNLNLFTGLYISVLFTHGLFKLNKSDVFTFNLNNLGTRNVFVYKNGTVIPMVNHLTVRDESGDSTPHYWFLQSGTRLEMVYDETLDSNNGGWLVLGNPIVLSSSSTSKSYTIYVDGWHTEHIHTTSETNSTLTITFSVPFKNTPYVIVNPHRNSNDSAGFFRFGYDITALDLKYYGIQGVSWNFVAEGY